jgi:hypothetical protein
LERLRAGRRQPSQHSTGIGGRPLSRWLMNDDYYMFVSACPRAGFLMALGGEQAYRPEVQK